MSTHARSPNAASTPIRRHLLHLPVKTLPQPDETTCGPTCLHAVYAYWGDKEPLDTVVANAVRQADVIVGGKVTPPPPATRPAAP